MKTRDPEVADVTSSGLSRRRIGQLFNLPIRFDEYQTPSCHGAHAPVEWAQRLVHVHGSNAVRDSETVSSVAIEA